MFPVLNKIRWVSTAFSHGKRIYNYLQIIPQFYPLTNYTILWEVEGFDRKPIRNDTKSYSNNNLNILKYCYCHM